jgi:hypothetical protein
MGSPGPFPIGHETERLDRLPHAPRYPAAIPRCVEEGKAVGALRPARNDAR